MFDFIWTHLGPVGTYLLVGLVIALILWLAELWETRE